MERITVGLGDRAYDIVVSAGGLDGLGAFVAETCGSGRKTALVTTDVVADLYLDAAAASLERAGLPVTTVVVPDGEPHKTLDTWEDILTRLLEARFERSSVVVPLGGGVVGDMAGFAAATLLRGIRLVQAPTTIVAQVDSSIGGKVGVDHPLGKNLVGSFYQPRGVLTDPVLLRTLPPREIVGGLAEVVKHAVIRDRSLFDLLDDRAERLRTLDIPDTDLEALIARNCRIKADVVAADEREGGLRAILNYGHTVGHALEMVTGYTRFRHGEAVMLGMVAAGAIAVRKGLLTSTGCDHQNRLIARIGFPRDLDGIVADDLIDAMGRDKKVADGAVRFVLAHGIGNAAVHADIGEADIRAGIDAMFAFVHTTPEPQ